jgi:hypothetical protein
VNSGHKAIFRGKFVEEILNGDGTPPYFRNMGNNSDIAMTISLPFY